MIHLDETVFIIVVLAVFDGERATLQTIQTRSGRRGLRSSTIVAISGAYRRNTVALVITHGSSPLPREELLLSPKNVIAISARVFRVNQTFSIPRLTKPDKTLIEDCQTTRSF